MALQRYRNRRVKPDVCWQVTARRTQEWETRPDGNEIRSTPSPSTTGAVGARRPRPAVVLLGRRRMRTSVPNRCGSPTRRADRIGGRSRHTRSWVRYAGVAGLGLDRWCTPEIGGRDHTATTPTSARNPFPARPSAGHRFVTSPTRVGSAGTPGLSPVSGIITATITRRPSGPITMADVVGAPAPPRPSCRRWSIPRWQARPHRPVVCWRASSRSVAGAVTRRVLVTGQGSVGESAGPTRLAGVEVVTRVAGIAEFHPVSQRSSRARSITDAAGERGSTRRAADGPQQQIGCCRSPAPQHGTAPRCPPVRRRNAVSPASAS